jgi:hypothetical protein
MRTKQATTLQSLRAAQELLSEHADKPTSVQATGASKRLDDAATVARWARLDADRELHRWPDAHPAAANASAPCGVATT